MRFILLVLSVVFIILFTLFSYNVAKEKFERLDFDTTVKLQDHIPRKFDKYFSYFSLIGSFEITLTFCLIMVLISLVKFRWMAIVGWFLILPASLGEIFGKLVLFHPSPPNFMHRSVLPTNLPSFYVHTDFSYPSGHMTRIVFIITILFCAACFSKRNLPLKYTTILILTGFVLMMGLTRISLGEHWLSDVLGGALLGIGFGLFGYMLMRY